MQDGAHIRQAEYLDDVAVLKRFGRYHVVSHDPVEPDADDIAVSHPAAVVAHHPADGALRDGHEPEIGIAGGRCERHVEGHPVEFGADRVGHHGCGLGEHLAFPTDALSQPRSIGIAGKAHRGLSSRGFVSRAVHRLGDPDLVDPLAGSGKHHGDHIGHTRVCTVAENRGIATLTSLSDAVEVRGCLLTSSDPGR